MRGQLASSRLVAETGPGIKDGKGVRFCGVRFDLIETNDVLAWCAARSEKDSFSYLVTPNVDHVVRLNREPDVFGPLYEGAALSLCDSRILELLAGLKNLTLPVTPGSDLTAALLESIIAPDEAVTIIGGDRALVANIKARYGLTRLQHYAPPMGLRHKPDEISKAARFIADHPARFVFICVGSPQQEMIARATAGLSTARGLGLCVGASLDFLAGRARRAPKWMQSMRLEWLFRLISEPRRMWKRYLIDGPRIFYLWLKWKKTDS